MDISTTLMSLLNRTKYSIKTNSPLILSATAVVGTVTTAYLASKATVAASKVVEAEEERNGQAYGFKEQVVTYVPMVWRLYIPAASVGAVTIACIIGSNRISEGRVASAVTAYSLADRAFTEYKEKVTEQLGPRKEQAVRDSIAEDYVKKTAPAADIVIAGTGHVLCCELYTGRYFMSDMESLKRAQNECNSSAINGLYCTVGEFQYLVGLQQTSLSNNFGWDADKLMELEFSAVMAQDGRPCLAFDYSYLKPLV